MVAASRRPRLRPCAPIGGMSVRGFADQRDAVARRTGARSRRRAESGRGRARPRSCRGSNASARSISSASAASSSARDAARPSSGSTTQTRLERSPGSGTSVNGPLSVWNSVEVSWCGRAMREVEGQRDLRIVASRRSRCRPPRGRASAGRRRRSRGGRRRVSPLFSRTVAPIVVRSRPRGASSVDPRQRRQVAGARCRARRPDGGSRCCGRRRRGRFRRPRSCTSGARISRAVSSTIRMTRSGAACAAAERPRRRASPARSTEPASSAVVRWSAGGGARDQRGLDPGLPPAQSPRSGRPGRRRRRPPARLMASPCGRCCLP